MILYLVRHGIAEPRESSGVVEDAARALTREGIRKMERNVAALADLGERPDAVWSSGLVRAMQTAELLAAGFEPRPALRAEEELAPNGSIERLMEALRREPMDEAIALVGHEPNMGELATYLIAGTTSGGVIFKKGGMACIEVDDFEGPVRGVLRWLMTPKQLGRIA